MKIFGVKYGVYVGTLSALLSFSTAWADELAPRIDTGDTAWMLIATALVFVMTPGLAFFYGGMVQSRHVVSTLFQSFISLGVIAVLWACFGYSLVFSGDHGGWIGDFGFAFLRGVGETPNTAYAATIPHELFMLFQGMFAVITPALITGAFAERIRFKAWLLILPLWMLLVYVPVAHSVWAVGGFLRGLGALDFAGGLVVHMTAGYSALVFAILMRKRNAVGATTPYDLGMVLLGTALLWFGWFGFNAGSALGSNGLAAHAFSTTFFAAAAAMVSWVITDVLIKGKPSLVGACVGAVAGLVAITPAAGFVTQMSGILIGLITGAGCNLVIHVIKEKFKLDDTLDVFGCHGIGGTFGTILTGLFATKSVNPAGADGWIYGGVDLMRAQLLSSVLVIAWSCVATGIIVFAVRRVTSLEVSKTAEWLGLDLSQHGERIHASVLSSESDGTLDSRIPGMTLSSPERTTSQVSV